MHKGHMAGCVIAIGLALVLVTTTGGSIGLGLLLAVLICPITMVAVMWFLMGSQRRAGTSPSDELMTHAPPANATTRAPHTRR